MAFFISNGWGASHDNPSERTMLEFLEALDPSDAEHGAAWLTDDLDNSLEFNGDGRLVFDREGEPVSRHMLNVSKERCVALWRLLADGRFAELELEAWQPGPRPTITPEEEARSQTEFERWQLTQDRSFYDALGSEQRELPCRQADCRRGRISQSVFCRVHHFEDIQGRACPFSD